MTPRSKLLRAGFRLSWRAAFRWYGLTARIGDERDGDPVLPAANLDALVMRLGAASLYRADKADTMRHPRIVQRRLNRGEKIGDCDDHASYVSAVLLKSNLAAEVYPSIIHFERDGKPSGHAFVLFRSNDGYADWYVMDYFAPTRVDTPRDGFEAIAKSFGATPICGAYLRADLRADDGLRLRRDGECMVWR